MAASVIYVAGMTCHKCGATVAVFPPVALARFIRHARSFDSRVSRDRRGNHRLTCKACAIKRKGT